ncbi:MAG: serine/threonine protein kinase, partial [Planctomycetes bacterium]|nr:serine/threonine protein kinase [Planctomycetota bacterium]
MTPERHQQIKKIFLAACDLEEGARLAYMAQACGDDADLRAEVEALLRHHHPATIIAKPAGNAPPGGGSFADDVASTASDTTARADSGAGSRPRERFSPGTVLADRYRVVSLLGAGGMGEVYRVHDVKLDQTVALKFIWQDRAKDPIWLARLRNEASLARRVTHPNVCRIHDIGEVDGQAFISMEYVDGENLASLLKRIGKLPRDKMIQIAWQLCAGLGAAHRQGVLHRDLKPANIMIDGHGDVRITDFGIAVLSEADAKSARAAGTPGYIAPEVLHGRSASVRSDIYALGLVLYEAITGQAVVNDENARAIADGRRAEPPSRWADGIDPAFERIVLRCLEPGPDDRPASVYEIAAALPGGDPLAAVLAAGDTPSPELVAATPVAGLPKRIAVGCLAGAVAALVAVILLADQSFVLSGAALADPPAVLEHKAKNVIAELDKEAPLAGRVHGFEVENRALESAVIQPGRTLHEVAASAMYFEYRQGESLNRLRGPLATPAYAEVPSPRENARLVRLDPSGQLLSYLHIPDRRKTPGTAGENPPWETAFSLAGLEFARFREIQPLRKPPVYADQNTAWEAVTADADERRTRVEGAALEGRIVDFNVIRPWENVGEEAMPGVASRSSGQLRAAAARYVLFVVITGGALGLAWFNLSTGRGDRRGAWRLAVFMFCTELVMRVAKQPYVPDVMVQLGWTLLSVRLAAFTGAVLWLAYVALEPYVRQFWPHSIVGWSKVLAGRIGDPAVGRDVLVGGLFGICITLFQQLNVVIPCRIGLTGAMLVAPVSPDGLGVLTGFRSGLGILVGCQVSAVWMGLLLMLLMLLLRVALRVQWLAAIAFFGTGT